MERVTRLVCILLRKIHAKINFFYYRRVTRLVCILLRKIMVRLGQALAADYPVAVPEKIIGLTLFLDFFDRCHSLSSLYLPLAALASLPLGGAGKNL